MGMSEPDSNVRLFPRVDTTPPPADVTSEQFLHWKSPYDDGAKPLVSVYVMSKAFVRISAHCATTLEHEVGGGLVGGWHKDPRAGGQFIVIEAVLPAHYTRQGPAYLTFTQDSLVAMHDELETRHPEKQLVGWYHTHPHMGIFLSHNDLWLHDHFFPEIWQVALVVEPHSGTGGFFIRQESGRLDAQRYLGFREIIPAGKSSVVHWTNLHASEEQQVSEGENQDE
jgi:proteasome lid subunit RPN8/RPN11